MESYLTPTKPKPPLRTTTPPSPEVIPGEGFRITLADLNIFMVNDAKLAPKPKIVYRTYFACPQESWQRFAPFITNKQFMDTFYDKNGKLRKSGLWLKYRAGSMAAWRLLHVMDMDAEGIQFEEIIEEKEICARLSAVLEEHHECVQDFGLTKLASLPVRRMVECKEADLSLHIDSVEFDKNVHYVVGAMSVKNGSSGRIPAELEDIIVYCPVRSKITEYLHTRTELSPLDRSPFFFSEEDLNHFTHPMTIPGKCPLTSYMEKSKLFVMELKILELKSRSQLSREEISKKLENVGISFTDKQLEFLANHDDAIVFYSNKTTTVLKLWFGLRAVEKTLCDLEGIVTLIGYRKTELRSGIPVGVLTNAENGLLATIYLDNKMSFLLHKDEDGAIDEFGEDETQFLRMLDNYVPLSAP